MLQIPCFAGCQYKGYCGPPPYRVITSQNRGHTSTFAERNIAHAPHPFRLGLSKTSFMKASEEQAQRR